MIVMCLREGLTVGDKLYRKGQIFKLSDDLEADYFKGLSDVEVLKRQHKVFSGLIFQTATIEEIFSGIQRAEVKLSELTEDEAKQVKEHIRALSQKRLEEAKATDDLMDLLLD